MLHEIKVKIFERNKKNRSSQQRHRNYKKESNGEFRPEKHIM